MQPGATSPNGPEPRTIMNDQAAHLCLYNEEKFSALNIEGQQRYCRIDYRAESRLIGSLAGVIDGGVFTSGYSAGFGGPDFLRDGEQVDFIFGLVDHCLAELGKYGIRRAVIRTKPQHYSASEPYVHFALLRRGFEIVSANINFYLSPGRYNSPEEYVQALKSPNRRHLRHGLAQNYEWNEAGSEEEWQSGYRILAENRRTAHDSGLSLSYDYIVRLRAAFHQRIRLFQLSHEGKGVAAVLIYDISRGRWQVMYWGDLGRGAYVAPMNVLAFHTVVSAMEGSIKTVDLGVSTSDVNINHGGIQFKTNVGGLPDMRYTMAIDLQ
jgi:hypothetical protein